MIVGIKNKYRLWLVAALLITSQSLVHAHWSDSLPFKWLMPAKTSTWSKYGLGLGAGLLLVAAAWMLRHKLGGHGASAAPNPARLGELAAGGGDGVSEEEKLKWLYQR